GVLRGQVAQRDRGRDAAAARHREVAYPPGADAPARRAGELVMMPTHHPTEELLFDYAAGTAYEAQGLVVATHLALCPGCRRKVRELETIGGALLDQLAATPTPPALEALLGRLDEPEPPTAAGPAFDAVTRRLVPAPLRAYLGANLKDITWRPVA